MKKVLLIAAAIVGLASTSQAGVDVRIGIGLPVPPAIIIGPRAPRFVVPPFVVPRVYVPPIVDSCPPPAYYGYGRGYYGWRRPEYRHRDGWGDRRGWDRYDRGNRWNGHRRW